MEETICRLGKYVYLEPLSEKHLPSIVDFMNDPEIGKFLEVDGPVDLEGLKNSWMETAEEDMQTNFIFAVCLRSTTETVGLCGLHEINVTQKTAVTGYYIGCRYLWGRGYGTEAQMLLLDYAFNVLRLEEVIAEVLPTNIRSLRCIQKCGYLPKQTSSNTFSVGRERFNTLHKSHLQEYKR